MNSTDKYVGNDSRREIEYAILRKAGHNAERSVLNPSLNWSLSFDYSVVKGKGGNGIAIRDSVFNSFRVVDSWGAYNLGFPLVPFGRVLRMPRWKDLSLWMKVQVGCMAVALDQRTRFKTRYISFNHHLNETLLARHANQSGNASLGELVRNEITRQCRKHCGRVLSFYFVIEEWDADRITRVAPHIHGSIEIPAVVIPNNLHGNTLRAYEKRAKQFGQPEADRYYGEDLVKKIMVRAIGHKFERPPKGWKAKKRDPQHRKPYGKNHNFVSYAFKNVEMQGHILGTQRVFTSRPFIRDAKLLWGHFSGR